MDQTINAYYTITASSEFRERERLYEKARHDEAQALYHAEHKGIEKGIEKGIQKKSFEVARDLKALGMPFEQIVKISGLSCAEVESL